VNVRCGKRSRNRERRAAVIISRDRAPCGLVHTKFTGTGAAFHRFCFSLELNYAAALRSKSRSEVDVDKIEKMARAMARADERDPDQPLTGFRRIVGQTVPVFRYDPKLPVWNYYVPLARLFIGASEALNEN
jgi:hypothetical protein